MNQKCFGTAECAWPLFAYPAYKKGLLGLLATGFTRPAPLAGARRIETRRAHSAGPQHIATLAGSLGTERTNGRDMKKEQA